MKTTTKMFGGTLLATMVLGIIVIIANLALLAGAVWVIVWALRETGVIQ